MLIASSTLPLALWHPLPRCSRRLRRSGRGGGWAWACWTSSATPAATHHRGAPEGPSASMSLPACRATSTQTANRSPRSSPATSPRRPNPPTTTTPGPRRERPTATSRRGSRRPMARRGSGRGSGRAAAGTRTLGCGTPRATAERVAPPDMQPRPRPWPRLGFEPVLVGETSWRALTSPAAIPSRTSVQ